MNPILKKIMDEKAEEVKRLRAKGVGEDRSTDLLPVRDFKEAVCRTGWMNLIAEVKYASPSSGRFSIKRDSARIGKAYETAGAAAISLVTDKRFFEGDIRDISVLKKAVRLPVLRKDFIIDAVQIAQSFINGADAILLIARILSKEQLEEMVGICKDFGMHALVEIHDEKDLEKALACNASIIGINNRDLDTFQVDIGVTIRIAPLVPEDCVVVSESGIRSAEDIRKLKPLGIRAVLVGTSLMDSEDIVSKTRSLVHAGKM
ncbi:MAG: indole-3-glycerol phosphate synthase [Desulfobacterales bacterium CG07_land_8_20_14_0_80_52_14]|nr:MAG: indole-3-glycerol phosphate synthase [Desulfobacterales bacterium CG23_combo_of_CG06-09_8_20_14_all_52_9]PIU49300.1 MAG: indole-3-glycerol phosphate synthase [Desulfobacterales bacterium CG07_land_8_20_14_0_80_52_14]